MAVIVISYVSEYSPAMDELKRRRPKSTRRTAKRAKPRAKKRTKK